MSLRAAGRAVALGFALLACVIRYWFTRLSGPFTLERRAHWMQMAAQGVLKSIGASYRVEGLPAARGLVVANHLSYLDILVLSAAMPCAFVAKAEIDRWPFFGKLARIGGTIFIDRSSRASASAVAEQIATRLTSPIPILVFAEGTSSDGSQVLRFHPTLFEPAIVTGVPVTAVGLRYIPEDGGPERELCWFDDQEFLSHLWKTLGSGKFRAELKFGEPHFYPDRRTAALATHAEVTEMRTASALEESKLALRAM